MQANPAKWTCGECGREWPARHEAAFLKHLEQEHGYRTHQAAREVEKQSRATAQKG